VFQRAVGAGRAIERSLRCPLYAVAPEHCTPPPRRHGADGADGADGRRKGGASGV